MGSKPLLLAALAVSVTLLGVPSGCGSPTAPAGADRPLTVDDIRTELRHDAEEIVRAGSPRPQVEFNDGDQLAAGMGCGDLVDGHETTWKIHVRARAVTPATDPAAAVRRVTEAARKLGYDVGPALGSLGVDAAGSPEGSVRHELVRPDLASAVVSVDHAGRVWFSGSTECLPDPDHEDAPPPS